MKSGAVVFLALLITLPSFGQEDDTVGRIKRLQDGYGRYLTLQEHDTLTAYLRFIDYTKAAPATSGKVTADIREALESMSKTVLERIEGRRTGNHYKYQLLLNMVLTDRNEKAKLQEDYEGFSAFLRDGIVPDSSAVLDLIDDIYASRYLNVVFMNSSSEYRLYTVVAGDNLRKIARDHYRDEMLWPLIHQASVDRLRHPDNPDLIHPGEKLVIPTLTGR
jgi:nucleoid-associated protein YgaU